MEETEEPREKHGTWTGDHLPATGPGSYLNPDRRGDKRVRYLCSHGYGFKTRSRHYMNLDDCPFKVIVLNTGIFWLLRTCSASFDHLIGEKTRMYFAKSLSDSIMNSYSLLPNITILIMQSTSMALQRI